MQITLDGKVAIVTGGARGIGAAISRQLLAAGASVVVADIDKSALDAFKQSSQSDDSHRLTTFAGDLTEAQVPQQLVDETLATYGSLDIIVNNAGYTWDSVIQKTTDHQFQAMLDIHVSAPFRLLRAASTWLREKAKQEAEARMPVTRKVVNITSISGLDGNPGQAGYASGKAAVVGLTKTLAKEWGRYSITVNAVGFGLIETRLIQSMNDDDTRINVGDNQVQVGMKDQVKQSVVQQIPLGRLGKPEDAANTVFFFCSPLSDYITGEVLVCGGGLHF